MLQDNVWDSPDVRDVTTDLRSAWDALVAEAGNACRRQVTIVVDRDEDGVWIAECPSIPGCVSQRSTEEKAISNILEAIQLYLEVRAERGLPLTVCNPTTGNKGQILEPACTQRSSDRQGLRVAWVVSGPKTGKPHRSGQGEPQSHALRSRSQRSSQKALCAPSSDRVGQPSTSSFGHAGD